MTLVRWTLPLIAGLVGATSAHANPTIATDEVVRAPDPEVVLVVRVPDSPTVVSPSRAPDPPEPVVLGDRFTTIPAFGLIWLEVLGEAGMGMAIQPTFTRTFDRFELQAELTLADWRDDTGTPHGGLFGRIGASAGYQAGRIRVEKKMTLDLVIAAGLGLQRLERDEGGSITRPDLAVGIGLRMLSDVVGTHSSTRQSRIFIGMEAMIRMLVMPRADARPDTALLLAFGVSIGR